APGGRGVSDLVLPVQPELLAGARVRSQPRALALVLLAVLPLTAPGPGAAYEVVTVVDGGAVAGTLKFVGTPPKLDPIPVNKNRDVCGERSEEHTSELQSRGHLVCRLLLEK